MAYPVAEMVWQLVATFCLGGAVCIAAAAIATVGTRAQSATDDKGRAEFETLCGKCHSLERSTARLRLTAEQWQAVVNNMVERGTEGTTDQLDRVVIYLAANFGPDKPLPKVNVNSASATALIDALPLAVAEAEAIVRHRERHGPFKDWSDLRKVSGLDAEKLEKQKDRIEFSTAQSGDKKGKSPSAERRRNGAR